MLQLSVLTAVSDKINSHSDKERSKKLTVNTQSIFVEPPLQSFAYFTLIYQCDDDSSVTLLVSMHKAHLCSVIIVFLI